MTVYLKDYEEFDAEAEFIDPEYNLKINYKALNYFMLINTFQF